MGSELEPIFVQETRVEESSIMEEQGQVTHQTVEIYQEETVAIRTRPESLQQEPEDAEIHLQITVSGIARKRLDDEDPESRKRQRLEDAVVEEEPSTAPANEDQAEDVAPDAAPAASSSKKPSVMVGVVVEKTPKEQKGDYEDFSSAAENEASPRPRNIHRRTDDQPNNSPAAKADVDGYHERRTGGRAAHIKFGDDMPPNDEGSHGAATTLPQDTTGPVAAGKPSVEDDDDDAPEAVALSAAQQTATDRKRKAEAAFKSQAASARQKRRVQDMRLKKQAVSGKRKAGEISKVAPISDNLDTAVAPVPVTPVPLAPVPVEKPPNVEDLSGVHPQRRAKLLLPDLLPPEILAAAPSRPPAAHLLKPSAPKQVPSAPKQMSRKHTVFGAEEKRPQEIRRGPVRVKVLEAPNLTLPPRASTAGRRLREKWLVGRKQHGGKPSVERRKLGSAFLKKS